MKTLGLSFDYHDAAAALVVDGEVIAAAQEERFTRVKNDARLPRLAIEFCLEQAGLEAAELDAVVFYELTHRKWQRILLSSLRNPGKGFRYFASTLDRWLRHRRFDVTDRIREVLPELPRERVRCIEHHQAHAASAFFCSPFERTTVVTLDGVGEKETATVSLGEGNRLTKLSSVHLPHSIGLFYSAFTAYLGFEVNEGEYKVMGMAAFGEPRFTEEIASMIEWRGQEFRIDQRYFEFRTPTDLPFTPALVERFGPARQPESEFRIGDRAGPPADEVEERSRYCADLAASVQRVVEETILRFARTAVESTGVTDLCMAGGVALNSLANGRIQRELGGRLYVQPAAGDAGGALGAALHFEHVVSGGPRRGPLADVYLGKAYDDEEVFAELRRRRLEPTAVLPDAEAMVEEVAERLARGEVIGWMQGRFEWGPRALGSRSILANPTRAETQRTVNEKIKFREPFRPFAPAVLAEHALDYFELTEEDYVARPEDFMLSVSDVRPERRAEIPAVTHLDGTARVQMVRHETNPRYAALLEAFARRTGVPILLNTSFNFRGEPIVTTPGDALWTFSWSEMDALAIGNVIVTRSSKRPRPPAPRSAAPAEVTVAP